MSELADLRAERGIYEPMFAPIVVQILLSTCANRHVALRRVAYARVQTVTFHDKNQEEIRLDLLLVFMAGRKRVCLNLVTIDFFLVLVYNYLGMFGI